MRYLSVCSGIEAASVAWAPLGWKASGFSEIEPFPCAVLKHHYPDVPNYGDMTLLPAKIAAGEIEPPDLLCGGTPCQAFSVAGLRKSLDDARGNLSLTFCEIANAIDSKREQPCIIFWENVPGVLNTKDNAFGCFLGALAGEADALIPPGGRWSNAGFIDGPQRAVAWRVLDAQYFGVAQRRRRVFVIASARADFDPAAVLFEFEGLRRDIAPSREAGKETTQSTSNGAGSSSTVAARMVAFGEYVDDGTASTMKMRDYKDATDLVSYGIPGNWIGRKPENGGNAVEPMHNVAPCLTKTDRHGVAQAIPLDLRNAGRDPEKHDKQNRQGVGVGDPGDASYTLTTACVHGVAPPIGIGVGDCAGTLRANPGSGFRSDGSPVEGVAIQNMAVRRLTPVECERLQGFPDGYTNILWRKQPESPDGPRYKALGNSWAVPVVRWIGERIDRAFL